MPEVKGGAPVVFLALLVSCGLPPEGEPEFWRPVPRPDAAAPGGEGQPGNPVDEPPGGSSPTGNGGAAGRDPDTQGGARPDAGGPAGGTGVPDGGGEDGAASSPDMAPAAVGPPSPNCKLEVTVTTISTNGEYAPRNSGAMWIANEEGAFVKTLAVWANRRLRHLTRWNQVTSDAGQSRNDIDAVTGASARNHIAHTGSWDCKDFDRQPVEDVAFQACFEVTESNSASNNREPTSVDCVPFRRSNQPFEMSPGNVRGFRDRRLTFTP